MGILVDENTRLMVQGITGREGSFHALRCREYGANLVAGVTPGRGGQVFDGDVPVFNTVRQAVEQTQANCALIFVPPPFAADAIVESVDAGIPNHRLHHRRHPDYGYHRRQALYPRQARYAHRP